MDYPDKFVIMEITAAVLYNGKLAHYDVEVSSDRECIARLASFAGGSTSKPPGQLRLRKEGRHWVSSDSDGSLPDDLGYAVELKAKPILEGRRRDGGHPAG